MNTITDLRKQGYDWNDVARVIEVITEQAREDHRQLVESEQGHSALTEYTDNESCLWCGHINEAEYVFAVIQSHVETGAYRNESP